MFKSLLAQKLTEYNEKVKRIEHNEIISKLLSIDEEELFWCEDKDNESLAERILAANNVMFQIPSDRGAYIVGGVNEIHKYLDINEKESVSVSLRLPSYIFTSWFSIASILDFYNFIYKFLEHESIIIFVLKLPSGHYVFANPESELIIYTDNNSSGG
jgi:hypothetical protein